MHNNSDQNRAQKTALRALNEATSAQQAAGTLGNEVTAVAAATGVAAIVPYVAIAAPALTVKNHNARVLVTGFVTIDKNAGSLLDGDEVILEPFINGVELGSFVVDTGAITAGGTVKALCPFSFIADTAVAAGATLTADMRVTTAGGHTSAVLANNGFISVIELPKAA